MGTSLYPIGNHNIEFKNKSFLELSKEIKKTLENSPLPNVEFLLDAALEWSKSHPETISDNSKIETKNVWTYEEASEYYNYKADKSIDFYGPYDLELSFEEHKIVFFNPHFRYWQWFEGNSFIHRDEWRKYMFHIVTLFGGNRVVYLNDNGKPLEEFLDFEGTFEQMEQALLNKFGKPKQTFQEVAADFSNSYLIDDFKTITSAP